MSLTNRKGFFLILVLIVLSIATFAAYSFTEVMIAYDDSSLLAAEIVQARVNVESGAEMTRLILASPPEDRDEIGGVYNNPQLFRAINASLGTDGVTPSYFAIVAPSLNEMGMYSSMRFGLQNESARLNINTLVVLEENAGALGTLVAAADAAEDAETEADSTNIAVSLLLALPGMTEEIAECILDYLDEDDIARTNGAEKDYYATLPTPYEPADGPLQSVDELLLVKGVTPTLLFGADSNRNGVLDADEQERFGISVDTPGALGWSAYLTVYGLEANKTRTGNLRVNINGDDLEVLYEQLLEALGGNELYASYIVAYRMAGQSSSTLSNIVSSDEFNPTAAAQPSAPSGGPWLPDLMEQLDLTAGGGVKLNQVLDLIDSTVTVGSGDNARSYTSPFPGDPISMEIYMPVLMDALSTQAVDVMPGRINLNECPAELLYGIPLLSEESVQQIIEARAETTDDPNRDFETWPMVQGIVTLEDMRTLLPLVTCGGDVYRAQIVGYYEDVGASHRSEVIIDATTVNPKIISWRDLSHLGRGFDVAVLGTAMGIGATGEQPSQ